MRTVTCPALVVALLALPGELVAQDTTVELRPAVPGACSPFVVHVEVLLSQDCFWQTESSLEVSGNAIDVLVEVTAGSPICLQVLTKRTFDVEVPALPAGAYDLRVRARVGPGEPRPVFEQALVLDGADECPARTFIRGDANADGTVDVADAVFVFNYLFTGGGSPPCMDAADTNDQGTVNITSGTYLLNHLFLGRAPPPPPFPGCGADETGDLLDCAGGNACAAGAELSLSLDTSGGFTGQGATDYIIEGGDITVRNPFGEPEECRVPLGESQLGRLLRSARAVDWEAVLPSYRSPENPDCCCDQIVSRLRLTITEASGETLSAVTDWCDESLIDGLLPEDLQALAGMVVEVGNEVAAACR